MAKRIVSVGDLVVDLVLDVRLPVVADGHQMSPTLVLEAGGAATTIFAARHMGLDVSAIGMLGEDFQGQMLKQIFDEAGVDTSGLVILPDSTTTTVIDLTDTQQKQHVFLGHYGEGDLIHMTDHMQTILLQADAVFMPGYTTVEERLQPMLARVFETIKAHNLTFYFDVGPFLGQLPHERVVPILALVDVLFLTEEEIPFVTDDKQSISDCRSLLETYPDMMIVLKTGATGCQIMTQAETIMCQGFLADVVDTVGAGDSFAGAFMWAHLAGYRLHECGLIANAMGAAMVQKSGAGRRAPHKQEVEAILQANQQTIHLA